MPVLRGPCQGSCPWFGSGFHSVGAALQIQFHELDVSPTAGPAERRRFEQRIAYRQRRAGIQQRRPECHRVVKGGVLYDPEQLLKPLVGKVE
jgi:hypothetical protein